MLLTLGWLAAASVVQAQVRPYIGYAYPAGGQQGTTFQIRMGGQNLDGVDQVIVTGSGASAKVVEYLRRLNNQELQLVSEQLKELKRTTNAPTSSAATMMKSEPAMMAADNTMMTSASGASGKPLSKRADATMCELMEELERRTREHVQTPACDAIASLVIAEVTLAPDTEPGVREIRLVTTRGVSNPLVFHVGQVPEHTREPMLTATKQVLGKEASALRKRATNDAEVRIEAPCTMNGQIASGEVNRYRFAARKGQRLVITTQARQLIPYIADAVPGWFQPVLSVYDAAGKEVAYGDDYRFNPDPTVLFEVPRDGDYVIAIHDSIYRGREDFIYRITLGEMPFITSIFPLGAPVGSGITPKMRGWNLDGAKLETSAKDGETGIRRLVASRQGLISNPAAFALDTWPEIVEREPNNEPARAQKVTLPVIINGRIDKPGDWDVFAITAKSNDTLVAEIQARQLDSPLDSVLKLTDASGKVLAFNDDSEDLAAGVNTHQADSRFLVKLPATGTCYVHLGDTAHKGGKDHAYRLRLSAPPPDFELRVVTSSVSLRTNATGTLTVYAQRKEGFTGPIQVTLNHPPSGFSASPITLLATQTVARLNFKAPPLPTKEPVRLSFVGSAKVGGTEVVRQAVPAEDRMQAFLWRHLAPAQDLQVLVFDPNYEPPPKCIAPALPPSLAMTNASAAVTTTTPTNRVAGTNTTLAATATPKFTKQQIVSRLRQLKRLFEEGLLTEDFYGAKVAECEVGQ